MKYYDVAIVGGGLLGSAFAWGLACRGLSTVVFDEGDNAIRTARGNFGLVWVQGKGFGMPDYARWSLESSRLWTELAERLQLQTGIDISYVRRGGFHICLDGDDFASQQELLKTMRDEALDGFYEYEVVEYAQLKKQIPLVGEVAGATYCPHDGHCNPLRLLRALHKGYLDNAGEYRPHSHITSLLGLKDGGFEVSAGNDKLAIAEKVIVAAGHGSAALGAQVGLDLPVFPDQGQVLVTEKVAPILDYPTDCVRQTDDGSFLLGPSSRDVGYNLKTDASTLSEIARRCIKAFPKLESLRMQRSWAALRVMTPDGFPVYQQSESHPGAFSFACHSGVTLASSHALSVTQWVEAGAIPADFEVFHPRRFHVQAH